MSLRRTRFGVIRNGVACRKMSRKDTLMPNLAPVSVGHPHEVLHGEFFTGMRRLVTGFKRLGLGLAVLGFVFWTCAYVIAPPRSEIVPWQSPFSPLTLILLGVAAIPVAQWVAVGFRRSLR
jgi:hypothetical protein